MVCYKIYHITHFWQKIIKLRKLLHGAKSLFSFQVSNIQEIFEALQEFESDMLSADISPADIITVISSVNLVMEVWSHCHYFICIGHFFFKKMRTKLI